ncbi:hypothetical protein [Flavobacterium sp.]|jgi:hypothetical protein|uniref:hypothetical protein n=1 Tax=Flavobacterium sp. TaxID=239 RepID=UPI0037BF24F3
MIACEEKKSNKSETKITNKKVLKKTFTISSFSDFPPEIDGCSCYFSKDSLEFKNEKYIYMNDFANISFLKINDTLVKFTQTDFKEVNKTTTVAKAKSNYYEMTIEVKDSVQSGDETWLKTGKIEITNKNGEVITETFYGECGC